MKKFLLFTAALTLLSACDQKNDQTTAGDVATPKEEAAKPLEQQSLAAWEGRWTGPEGTYLDIAPGAGTEKFTLKIRNLDGERSFDGMAEDGTINFERDGVGETIRPGDGQATGMKWLADKKDCLVVKTGEGYCRD